MSHAGIIAENARTGATAPATATDMPSPAQENHALLRVLLAVIAAAFGSSMIAGALGISVNEVPGIGGFLVKPQDPDALAPALLTALALPAAGVGTSPTVNDLARDIIDMYRSSRKLGAYVHV